MDIETLFNQIQNLSVDDQTVLANRILQQIQLIETVNPQIVEVSIDNWWCNNPKKLWLMRQINRARPDYARDTHQLPQLLAMYNVVYGLTTFRSRPNTPEEIAEIEEHYRRIGETERRMQEEQRQRNEQMRQEQEQRRQRREQRLQEINQELQRNEQHLQEINQELQRNDQYLQEINQELWRNREIMQRDEQEYLRRQQEREQRLQDIAAIMERITRDIEQPELQRPRVIQFAPDATLLVEVETVVDDGQLCYICRDEPDPNRPVKKCGHCEGYVHVECIRGWHEYSGNSNCGYCRHPIRYE